MDIEKDLAQFAKKSMCIIQNDSALGLTLSQPKVYVLDIDKVKTLEDVKQVLAGLDIRYTVWGDNSGAQPCSYHKLKKYLKEEDHG
jgi:hypothetical protein